MAFHIDTAATTQPAIEVEANALTTGKGMLISSNSADTSARQLLRVTNDHASATATTNLYVDNDSTGLVADFHGTGGIRSRYGIKFGTDTTAQNTLDDYEEGDWTPTIVGGTLTRNLIRGSYTKVGRKVFIQCYMNLNSDGNATTMVVGGLPFNTASNGYFTGVVNNNRTTVGIYARTNPSNSTIGFYSDNAQGTINQNAIDNTHFIFSLTYDIG